MKNLPVQISTLLCALTCLAAPASTWAASATLTFPGSVNLNLPGTVDPAEDMATRRTDITLDDGQASNTLDFSEGATNGWGTVLAKSTAKANPGMLSVSSPGQGNTLFLNRSTSYDFTNLAAPVSGSISFNYSFDNDNSTDPNAFLYASLSFTIIDKTTNAIISTISPSATAQASAGPGNADKSGTLSLNFTINPGQAALLSVLLTAGGAAEVTPAPVPVPAALPLLGSALAGLAGFKVRRKSST